MGGATARDVTCNQLYCHPTTSTLLINELVIDHKEPWMEERDSENLERHSAGVCEHKCSIPRTVQSLSTFIVAHTTNLLLNHMQVIQLTKLQCICSPVLSQLPHHPKKLLLSNLPSRQ